MDQTRSQPVVQPRTFLASSQNPVPYPQATSGGSRCTLRPTSGQRPPPPPFPLLLAAGHLEKQAQRPTSHGLLLSGGCTRGGSARRCPTLELGQRVL